MIILIDPGLVNCGIVVLSEDGKILSSKTLKMTSKESQESRLFKIFDEVCNAASGEVVEAVFSESQFVTIMSEINGVVRAAAGKLGAVAISKNPSSWKKSATGKGNIKEDELREFVIEKFPEAKEFDEHQIDCLGMYVAYKNGANNAQSVKKRTKK